MRKLNYISETIERDENPTLRIGSAVCRFYHPAVGSGDFVRRFVRPVYGEAIIIRLDNGREWVAPSWEFNRVS